MDNQTRTPASSMEFLDITPLARRYGFRFNVRIARDLADRASNETVVGCLLRAAADALTMRGSCIEPMNPLVFAIKTLRAPAQLLGHLRLAMQFDDRNYAEPTITLRMAA